MWNTASLIPEERRHPHHRRHDRHGGTGMPSIEDHPNARQGKPGSDHAALVATIDF